MKQLKITSFGLRNIPIGGRSVPVRCPATIPYSKKAEQICKIYNLKFKVIDDTPKNSAPKVEIPAKEEKKTEVAKVAKEAKEVKEAKEAKESVKEEKKAEEKKTKVAKEVKEPEKKEKKESKKDSSKSKKI